MFKPGERVYVPGGSGEPSFLLRTLLSTPHVRVSGNFVPGINTVDPDSLAVGVEISGPFMHPGMGQVQRQGRYRHVPRAYSAMVREFETDEAFDCCIIQISEPDDRGVCSLGPCGDFLPVVLPRARRIVAAINPYVPFVRDAVTIARADCEIVTDDSPLVTYRLPPSSGEALTIAERVALLIPDGAILQVGLGVVPSAVLSALTMHKDCASIPECCRMA